MKFSTDTKLHGYDLHNPALIGCKVHIHRSPNANADFEFSADIDMYGIVAATSLSIPGSGSHANNTILAVYLNGVTVPITLTILD